MSALAMDYLRQILRAKVYDVAKVSPLSFMGKLSQRLQLQVHLKREDLQPVHSFKLRGASNRIHQLSAEQKRCGVVCASAGNHAQGVALSASHQQIRAVIVMPCTTPEIKVDAVRRRGGEVILHGQSFDEANDYAKSLSHEQGLVYIAPFDDPAVIAGQGTVAQELLQQRSELEAIYVPVGGGGLIAGIAAYYKAVMPQVKIIGVEPEDSACLQAALAAGERIQLDRVGLFADGVAVKQIGAEPFRLAQLYVDEVVTVSSDEICAAIKDIFEDTRAIAEPAGALALAGLKKHAPQAERQQVAAILSGANVNFHSLRYVSERCELGEQREAVFAVQIPEQAGSFLQFCQLLDKRAVTEFNYRFHSNKGAVVFAGVRLTAAESNAQSMIERLTAHGFVVQDLSQDETAKLHVRYMIGGHLPKNELGQSNEQFNERLFRFQFPEHPGALLHFLTTLQSRWNISLFHYRNHGAAFGQVLVGFDVNRSQQFEFNRFLKQVGFPFEEETNNPAYQLFLQ